MDLDARRDVGRALQTLTGHQGRRKGIVAHAHDLEIRETTTNRKSFQFATFHIDYSITLYSYNMML